MVPWEGVKNNQYDVRNYVTEAPHLLFWNALGAIDLKGQGFHHTATDTIFNFF